MKMKLRRETIFLFPLCVATMLAGGGCAAAGLAAAGPLLSAIGTIGSRSIERTLSADLETAWTATVETFSRMEIRVRHTDRSRDAWVLKGTGGTVELHAELAPVTPRMTKVSLRAEAGGLQADKRTTEEILNQVALSLKRQPAVAVLAHAPPDAEVSAEGVLAAPLVPVKVLTPVRPLGGKQTVR